MAYTQAKHIQNITVRNQFRISERVNLERGVTSYFPGDRDKESTHSPFSPCTNRVGCVRCWGNFAETNRLALNGLKLWSPFNNTSVVSSAGGRGVFTVHIYIRLRTRARWSAGGFALQCFSLLNIYH